MKYLSFYQFICAVLTFLTTGFFWIFGLSNPVYAQNNNPSSKVEVTAYVAPNLEIDLDYPKQGDFYVLADNEYLSINGFANISNQTVNFSFQETSITQVQDNFQYTPKKYGQWSWTAPKTFGVGNYQLTITAYNSLSGLMAKQIVYLNIYDSRSKVMENDYPRKQGNDSESAAIIKDNYHELKYYSEQNKGFKELTNFDSQNRTYTIRVVVDT